MISSKNFRVSSRIISRLPSFCLLASKFSYFRSDFLPLSKHISIFSEEITEFLETNEIYEAPSFTDSSLSILAFVDNYSSLMDQETQLMALDLLLSAALNQTAPFLRRVSRSPGYSHLRSTLLAILKEKPHPKGRNAI